MPHDTNPSPSEEYRNELEQLQVEIARLRRINEVLMDRVEQTNSTTGSSLGLFHLATELAQQIEGQKAALMQSAVRAEAANRSKSEFLANMSHEIRTPMTAILGYADLLTDSTLSDRKKLVHIATIKRNGEHLLAIINNILDISKIEAGKMTVERVPTSIVQVIEEVASLMRVRATEKGLCFDVRYDSPMPAEIDSDPMRLRQILVNLVGNAVKFTDHGGVTLRARFDRGPEPCVHVEVQDTGIGIPEDKLDQLFEPFTQADSTMTRRFGGSGLGLGISRSLAELLGWTLSLRSRPGTGSVFSLAHALPAGEIPLLDLDQICAISAAIKSGSDLERPAGANSVSPSNPLECSMILLAEDGPDNQRLIRFYLERAGAGVIVVDNGLKVLDAVYGSEDRVPAQTLNLILLDMQMPEMDGYTAARELRRRGCSLPIVALTAHAMSGDREKCLEAGCDDYLTKPVDRSRLIEVCGEWLFKCPGLSRTA